jgi:uncharacterized protein (TIGR00288 family)
LSRNDSDANSLVALYWDFENLHASLTDARLGEGSYNKPDGRFKSQEPLIDVQAIVELAASYGPIAINRAYCNWQYFGRYRDALLQGAVELIQLFSPGASAKNGADIKLCLDAVEDIGRFGHIRTIVIVGGDSDFMPVSQKIKAAGRTLVGIGARKSTNRHWAKSCHEFRYYESLVEAPDTAGMAAADLLKRALRLLAETQGDPWVSEATVWHMIKRLDPAFDAKDHGYASFPEMVRAFDPLVEARLEESGASLRLR